MSHDLARPCDQGILQLYGKKLLTVCNNPASLVVQGHCGSGYIMFLIYHVTSCYHEFKGLCNFYAWELLIVSHCLAKFGDHNSCGSRNITDLIFHVTLKGRVNNGLVALCKEAPLCTSIYQPCQVW